MDDGEQDEADDLEVGPQEDGSVGDDCVIVEVVRHPQYRDDCHDDSRDGCCPDPNDQEDQGMD